MSELLKVTHLHKEFGKNVVLKDINLIISSQRILSNLSIIIFKSMVFVYLKLNSTVFYSFYKFFNERAVNIT